MGGGQWRERESQCGARTRIGDEAVKGMTEESYPLSLSSSIA